MKPSPQLPAESPAPAAVSFFSGNQESEDNQVVQPALFPDEQAYEEAERRGDWTLERLRVRRPEILTLVCRMIAEGLSNLAIARACRVSPNTVLAVRRLEQKSIDDHKQELLALTRGAARLTLERVIETAPTMKPGEASVAFGIVTEKMLLLGGDATTIVGTASDKMKHADFNEMLAALPQADVIEMGSSGGISGQRAGAGGEGSGAISGGSGGDSDSRSDVFEGAAIDSEAAATGCDTGCGSVGDVGPRAGGGDDQGGRGSAEGGGGHQS